MTAPTKVKIVCWGCDCAAHEKTKAELAHLRDVAANLAKEMLEAESSLVALETELVRARDVVLADDALASILHTYAGLEGPRKTGKTIRALVADRSELRRLLTAAHAETWRLVDALIAALPQCDSGCHATKSCPATKSWGRGGQRYCDECAGSRIPDYPHAAPLRALLAARDARKGRGT